MTDGVELGLPQPVAGPTYKRLWCAFASAAIPGLGDWILGAKRRGLVFSAFFFLLLLCYWPLRLPRFYWAFIVMVIAGMLLNVISSCCTFFVNRIATDAARNWWVLVLVVLGYVFAAAEAPTELRAAGFRVFSIPSESMSPTIDLGDYAVVDIWYFFHRPIVPGNVVVFRHKGIFFVKRVIATGGSTVVGVHDQVSVDGRALIEPYAVHRDSDHPPDERDDFGPVQIQPEHIFVMGDNRDFSLDSRFLSGENEYGPVFNSDVVGKPLYRFRRSFHRSDYDGQAIK